MAFKEEGINWEDYTKIANELKIKFSQKNENEIKAEGANHKSTNLKKTFFIQNLKNFK